MRTSSMLPIAFAATLATLPTGARLEAQQSMPFLVGASDSGVVLRWVWPEDARPAGYFVERQPATGGAWTRLTTQPVTRIRDRARARGLLGAAFDRYAPLLFPTDPSAAVRNAQNAAGIMLLYADVDARFATVLGLRYEDTTSIAAAFVYRLIGLTPSGERVLATSAPVVPRASRVATPPDSLTVTQYRTALGLRWRREMRFSAYNVYRSIDGRPFAQINDAPVVLFTDATPAGTEASPIYYLDVAGAPGDTVRYAVEGIDAFARPSARSPSVAVVVADVTPPMAPGAVRARALGDSIALTWSAPADGDVQWYRIARAPADTGPYTTLPIRATRGDTVARDRVVPVGRVFWYRVTAVDRAGNVGPPSAPVVAEVPDLVPPPVPTHVHGTADSGIVRLAWSTSTASDLRGYRVYRASVTNGTFGLLTEDPIPTGVYTDTVPERARHAFYYRVTAVDSAYNESAPSDTAAVRPPDHTPPSAPLATVAPGEDLLIVTWLPNPEPDVAGYLVRWRARADSSWQLAKRSVPRAQLADTLRDVPPRRLIEIEVLAFDSAANVSLPSPTVVGEAYHRAPPPAPDFRGAAFDATAAGVVLAWRTPALPATRVMIMRRPAGGAEPFRAVGEVDGAGGRYVDRAVRRDTRYEYRLDAIDPHGNTAEGRRTRTVDVTAGRR